MDTNHNSKSAEHNRKKASTSVASAGSSSASASEDEHSVATAGNYTSFFSNLLFDELFKKKRIVFILISRVFFFKYFDLT